MAILLLSFSVFAMNGRTTYQAKIVKPDGYPLESSNVNFRFSVLDSVGSCVIYVEDYTAVNMAGSGGLISFGLGGGVRSFPVSGTSQTFQNTFDNSVTSFSCQSPGIYNPGPNDTRKIVMQFNDGSGWQTLPAMAINAVPYSMYAAKAQDAKNLNGKIDTDFVEKINVPICTSDKMLYFNGVSFSCVTYSAGSSGISSVTTSGSVLTTAGTASAPVISITAATISQDGYLTALDYAEFKSKLSASSSEVVNTLGYAPVSASAVAAQIESAATSSGTASTIVKRDSSGNFTATDIYANSTKTNYVDIYKPSTSFNIRLQAPTSLAANYTLTLPTTSGTSGQVLSTDGLGNLSWVNASTGSVTNVSGTVGEITSSGGSTPAIGLVNTGTVGTYYKVTTDNKGRVTSGVTTLTLSDLPVSVINTTSNFSGDISGLISSITVNRIQGVSITITSLTANDLLQFDGAKYVNRNIPTCSGSQYLTFNGTNFSCAVDAGASGTITTISVAGPISSTGGSNPTLSIAQANTSVDGYLSATDWNSFNSKQTATSAAIIATLGYTPANNAASGTYVVKSNNLSDLTNITTARTNLGLGSLATGNSIDLGSASATGTLAVVRLPSFIGDATVAAASNTIVFSNSGVTAGTYNKVTVDSKGRVTSSSSLVSADVTTALGYTPASASAATQWVTSGSAISYVAGNVGIGTTNPAKQLAIHSAGLDSYVHLTSSMTGTTLADGVMIGTGTAGDAAFYNRENTNMLFLTNNTERVRIDNTGNVGIGTTNPVTKLAVSGGIKISMESATCATSYAGTLRYNSGNVEYCNGTSWSAFGVAGAGINSINGSTSGSQTFANSLTGTTPTFVTINGVHTLNIPFASAAATAAGLISFSDYTNFNNKITSSTTSISEVLGYVPVSSTTLDNYVLRSNNLSDLTSIVTARTNLGLGGFATVSSLDLGSASATGTLAIARLPSFAGDASSVSGSNILTLANSGVFSGTYTKVIVDTKGRVTSGAQIISSDVIAALGYTPANSATTVSSQWSTSGTTINYANGNVGIGTTAPNHKLEVAGTVYSTIDSFSEGGQLILGKHSGYNNNWVVDNYMDQFRIFSTINTDTSSGTVAMTITASGNIGIGTTSPTQKLTVAGTIESTTGGVKFPDGTIQATAAGSGPYKAAEARTTTVQSVANGTWTIITNLVKQYDTGGFWSAATPDRFTIPVGINYVRVTGYMGWATNSVGPRYVQVFKNGVAIFNGAAAGPYITTTDASSDGYGRGQVISPPIPVVAGDYLQMAVWQSSGAALNLVDGGISIEASNGTTSSSAGSGTANYIPLWIDSVTLGNSPIAANGGKVGIGTSTPGSKLNLSVGAAYDGVRVDGGASGFIHTFVNAGTGSNNGITQAGDKAIIYGGTAVDSAGGLVIAPWKSAASGLRLDANGNVGIGTASPAKTLHVSNGNTSGGGAQTNVQIGDVGAGSGPLFLTHNAPFISGNAYFNSSWIYAGGTAKPATISPSDGIHFITSNNAVGAAGAAVTDLTEKMTILPGGNVGIGITNPSALLHVNGHANINSITGGQLNGSGNFHIDAFTSGADRSVYLNWNGGTGGAKAGNGAGAFGPMFASAFNVSSDRRLKKDIQPIENGLEKILKLDAVTFSWKDAKRNQFEGQKIGLIAQNVEQIFPQVVNIDRGEGSLPGGTRVVAYSDLVAPLISAIQEFYRRWFNDSQLIHREIATVKAQTAKLESENEAKDKEIAVLKAKAEKAEQEKAEIKARLDRLEKLLLSK